jgi:hypothetical protein
MIDRAVKEGTAEQKERQRVRTVAAARRVILEAAVAGVAAVVIVRRLNVPPERVAGGAVEVAADKKALQVHLGAGPYPVKAATAPVVAAGSSG